MNHNYTLRVWEFSGDKTYAVQTANILDSGVLTAVLEDGTMKGWSPQTWLKYTLVEAE